MPPPAILARQLHPTMFARSVSLPPYPLVRQPILVLRYSTPILTHTRRESTRADPAGKPLPESPAETYRKYNRLAFNMEGMHHELRQMWLGLQAGCARAEKSLDSTTGRRLIERGLSFCHELEVHHDREEAFLFPKLAARMPEFGSQSALVDQHKQIHVGVVVLKEYLLKCYRGESALDHAEMKKIMDTFSETLWAHLDDEVYALRAERIRQYWTVDEFRKIP